MAIVSASATPRLDLLGPIINDAFDRDSFVADRVLPTFLVEKKAGAIPSFLFTDSQIINIVHARGMGYARIQSQIDQKTFNCTESGLEEPLTNDDYDIISRDQAEAQISRKLVNIVLRQRDYAMATTMMGTGGATTFAGQITSGSATWATTGNPFTDIESAKVAIWQRTGCRPDKLLMSYSQYANLCKNSLVQTQIRAILGYSGTRVSEALTLEIDPNNLKTVFGLREIIVANGTYNSAPEGQTPVYTDIWPTANALLFKGYDAGEALNNEPGLGRMFVYDQANVLGQLATGSMDTLKGLVIEMYREEKVNADLFRVREYLSQTLLVPTAAQLIQSI